MYKRNTHHTNNILYYYIAIAELHFNTVHGLNPCLGSNIEHRSDKTIENISKIQYNFLFNISYIYDI